MVNMRLGACMWRVWPLISSCILFPRRPREGWKIQEWSFKIRLLLTQTSTITSDGRRVNDGVVPLWDRRFPSVTHSPSPREWWHQCPVLEGLQLICKYGWTDPLIYVPSTLEALSHPTALNMKHKQCAPCSSSFSLSFQSCVIRSAESFTWSSDNIHTQ